MSSSAKQVDCLFVIGLGLIGGSFAKATREAGLFTRVLGFDEDEAVMQSAVMMGVIDSNVSTIAEGVAQANVILIAVPALAIPALLRVLKDGLPKDCVVTDVASVKGSVERSAKEIFNGMPEWLVLGHPIAGSERSGVIAAKSDLFAKHKVILTPLANTDAKAVQTVSRLWVAIGAEVVEMTTTRHDEVFAATSHLPHIMAYTLVDALLSMEGDEEMFRFVAGGFRDFTRIASSSPKMWHDIVLANKSSILDAIDGFAERLMVLREQIVQSDGESIFETFSRAKSARDEYAQESGHESEQDLQS